MICEVLDKMPDEYWEDDEEDLGPYISNEGMRGLWGMMYEESMAIEDSYIFIILIRI